MDGCMAFWWVLVVWVDCLDMRASRHDLTTGLTLVPLWWLLLDGKAWDLIQWKEGGGFSSCRREESSPREQLRITVIRDFCIAFLPRGFWLEIGVAGFVEEGSCFEVKLEWTTQCTVRESGTKSRVHCSKAIQR